MGTSGPASAHASSEVNRTTASAGSSSEVGTTVVIVEALCYRKEFKTLAFAAEQRERERERETLGLSPRPNLRREFSKKGNGQKGQ